MPKVAAAAEACRPAAGRRKYKPHISEPCWAPASCAYGVNAYGALCCLCPTAQTFVMWLILWGFMMVMVATSAASKECAGAAHVDVHSLAQHACVAPQFWTALVPGTWCTWSSWAISRKGRLPRLDPSRIHRGVEMSQHCVP